MQEWEASSKQICASRLSLSECERATTKRDSVGLCSQRQHRTIVVGDEYGYRDVFSLSPKALSRPRASPLSLV